MASMGYLAGGFIAFLVGSVLGRYFYSDGELWVVVFFLVVYVSGYVVMRGVDDEPSV